MFFLYFIWISARQFSSEETVTITYVDPNGDEHPVEAKVGQHLLDVAHANNIELEGMTAAHLHLHRHFNMCGMQWLIHT